jgi:hypothetical protein
LHHHHLQVPLQPLVLELPLEQFLLLEQEPLVLLEQV